MLLTESVSSTDFLVVCDAVHWLQRVRVENNITIRVAGAVIWIPVETLTCNVSRAGGEARRHALIRRGGPADDVRVLGGVPSCWAVVRTGRS